MMNCTNWAFAGWLKNPLSLLIKRVLPTSLSDVKIINPLRDTAIQRLLENISCIVSDNRQKVACCLYSSKHRMTQRKENYSDSVSPRGQRTAPLLDQIMLKRLLSKLTGDRQQIERHLKNQYRAEENGLSFPQSLVDDRALGAGITASNWLKKTI